MITRDTILATYVRGIAQRLTAAVAGDIDLDRSPFLELRFQIGAAKSAWEFARGGDWDDAHDTIKRNPLPGTKPDPDFEQLPNNKEAPL